jgi:hypothetical protein
LNKKEKKMSTNVKLEDLQYMSVDELNQLTTEQVEELRRQYRITMMKESLSSLTPEQIRFLGYDPDNLSNVSEYSMNMNMLKSPQTVRCSRYSTQSPNGVMLYTKNSGTLTTNDSIVTSTNGRTQNNYWYPKDLLRSSNELYAMQIESDGNVVLLDNNMSEVWSLKKVFGSFKSIVSFEIENYYDSSDSTTRIIELDSTGTPTINATLLPFMKNRTTTKKSYEPYGIRVNDVGDLLFEAVFIEEYPDQTKTTYVIPYFTIQNTKNIKGPYEFVLNNNRVFEVRGESKTVIYATDSESYGILRPIPENLYESLNIDPEELTIANCAGGTVVKTEVSKIQFDVNDFENGDLLYDSVTREFFRVYNYTLGLMTEEIMKTWYKPKIEKKGVYEDYYTHVEPYEFVFPNYSSTSSTFSVSIIFQTTDEDQTLFTLSDSFVVSMKSGSIYLNDQDVGTPTTSRVHFVWIQENTKNTVYINSVKSYESDGSNDVNFKKIETFTLTSSFRMYSYALTKDDVETLYKDDVYSPGMKIKLYDTYLFKKGNAYKPNSIKSITEESIVYFENDDSILFQYKEKEQRFIRFIPNKFSDRNTLTPLSVPYDYTVLSSGDLIYDPVMQRYYRFYNESIGLLPTFEILMSWYNVDIGVLPLMRKSRKTTKPVIIPKISLGTKGVTITFFIKTRAKNSTLYSFGDDVYAKIEDGVFLVNGTKVNKRISNDTNYFITIQTLQSGRVDVYVDTKRVTQINGKTYPQNSERSLSIGNVTTDFTIYQSILTTEQIEKLYKRSINSPGYNSLYSLDTRGIPKGDSYEFLTYIDETTASTTTKTLKIMSIDGIDVNECKTYCDSVGCTRHEIHDKRCELYDSSDVVNKIKSRYIYIENDKSKTYDTQTKKETTSVQTDATPVPYDKIGLFVDKIETTTISSTTATGTGTCPIKFWKVLLLTIVVLLFLHVINKMLKGKKIF